MMGLKFDDSTMKSIWQKKVCQISSTMQAALHKLTVHLHAGNGVCYLFVMNS